MGCNSSSQAQTAVSTQRRRLSVGEVRNEGGSMADEPSTEEKRGAIQALSSEDLIAMMHEKSTGGGRRFSIGSKTDAGTQSFSVKKTEEGGDGMDKSLRIGYTCRKGLKPESPNQDSWSIVQVDDDFSIYAVYDGHGGKGHDVSNFVKDTVPKLILKDPRFRTADMPAMLVDVFKTTQSYVQTMDQTKQLSAQMAGTTATVVIHDKVQNQLTVAHVADSTCVLGRYTDDSKKNFDGVALTRDHKPDLQDERRRIEKAGGRVVFDGYANYRVYAKNGQYPGLNMSRCLGDLLGHQDAGCSAEPETSVVKIEPHHNALLLCSDGVWEFIKPAEAVNIVMALGPDQAQKAADKLAKEAWDRWIQEEGGQVVDDITVVLVHLNV
eukprot:TRINITY_DN2847_c0_g1_i1.p1 TRINITY_DN2847_c0_g1~~TRINITY_DN2847_c0_g1_i1.p1  ORF type:complete len:380 (+),score=74.12 TRINITY_DN2847_c0_g1_i1:91-1230(+)